MKKGKLITMPTSVEAQIRTRARNLPIDVCYISEDWTDSKSANVIVTRKHANGKISYGYYLVDLLLRGVHNCAYAFNVLPAELDELMDDLDDSLVECDYALAHNMIYEGIAFAEENGFEPVKDFTKAGEYILEEDNGMIPHIDIPVGIDGMPVVVTTPALNMQREIAILEKTVGSENFIICRADENGNLLMDDDDYDDDDYDDDDDFDDYDDDNGSRFSYDRYSDTIMDIFDKGVDGFLATYGIDLTQMQMMALYDVIYEAKFGIDNEANDGLFDLIMDDKRFDSDLERHPAMEKYIEPMQSIIDKMFDDKEAALIEMETLVAAHPDDVYLGISHIALLYDLRSEEEVERLINYWYNRASDNYVMRLFYANWLVRQERFDDLFELFGNIPGLDALTKEDLPFTEDMVSDFCACYVLAWLSKDNIAKAEPYYRLLLLIEKITKQASNAIFAMSTKKKKAIKGS